MVPFYPGEKWCGYGAMPSAVVIKSGKHKHKAARASVFLMTEQNNTLKSK